MSWRIIVFNKTPTMQLILIATVVAVWAHVAEAKLEVQSKGELALEGRGFLDDHDPLTKDFGIGLFGRLEASLEHRPFKEKLRVFGRIDQQDAERSLFVVEELWAEWKWGRMKLRVGADILNWSATEAFHPADVINARNLDSDAENYEKVGEPMVSLFVKIGHGGLTAYYMPYYSRPILPSLASRLNFIPAGITLGDPVRMTAVGNLTQGDFGPQGALRFTQSIGSADISVYGVHQMDRSQPEVLIDAALGKPRPLFRAVTHVGVTYQQVFGALILKLESGYRIFAKPDGGVTPFGPVQDRDHLQVALGAEYGWTHSNDWESTVIFEGQAVFFVEEAVRRALLLFQRDLLAAYRLTFGDEASSQLLLSGIFDVEDGKQMFVNASFSRRFFETWSLAIAARLVFAPNASLIPQGLYLPSDSDHVRLTITRHF